MLGFQHLEDRRQLAGATLTDLLALAPPAPVAVNASAQGREVWILSSTAVATAPTIASAPTITSANPGDGQVTLTWTAPASNGGAEITNYAVRVSTDGGLTWTRFPRPASTALEAKLTGLNNGTNYMFEVRAVNPAGPGALSNRVTVVPRTTPSAPTITSANPGDGQVTLTWTAPASNGGAAITNYAVRVSTDGGLTWTRFPRPASTALEASLTGLNNGTNYMFEVRAVNPAGPGALSNRVTVVPRTTPSAPTITSANPGDGQVTLTWTAPASNGGAAVAGYVIEFKSVAEATWKVFATTDSPALAAVVTGLQNGSAYVFRVSARNVAGTGSPSPESPSVRPWAPWMRTAGGTGADSGRALAVLPDGSTLVTGSFEGTMAFGSATLTSAGGTDLYVARLDPTGAFVWATRAGGPGYDSGTGIAALADGSALVTGRFEDSVSFGSTTLPAGGFVAKFDAAGNVVWAKSSENVAGIAALPDGSSIVVRQKYLKMAGQFLSINAIAVARFNPAGAIVWETQATPTGYSYVSGVSALPDGSAIITGAFDGTATFGTTTLTSAGISDTFVAKVNAAGSFVWATRAGGTGTDYGQDVAVLPDGSVLVAGRFDGTATFGQTTLTSAGSSDAFVAKLNAAGSFVWATRAGGAEYDFGSGIAVLPDGSAILAGNFEGTATFGTKTLTSAGFGDAFVARLDSAGAFAWASSAGGPGNDDEVRVAAHADGSAVVTGRFEGTAAFGATTRTSAGGPDIFLAKLDAAGSWPRTPGSTTDGATTGFGGVTPFASTSGAYTTAGTVPGGGSAWTTVTGVKAQTPGGKVQQTNVTGTGARTATWTFKGLTPAYYRVEILFSGRFDNSASVQVLTKSTKDTIFIASKNRLDMRRPQPTFVNIRTDMTLLADGKTTDYVLVDSAYTGGLGNLSVRLRDTGASGRMVVDSVVLTAVTGIRINK